MMSQTDLPPSSETAVSTANYLEFLRLRHDGYPDCCTLHVQYQILSEHRVFLERDLLPL